MDKSDILRLMNETKVATLPYFDLSDADLRKQYGPGKWSVRQILHHLTDTEYLFIGRLKKIIAEPKQVIWAFDQDAWDTAFAYSNASLTGKRELYAMCRDINCALVHDYHDEFAAKPFVHNETGLRTLGMEFEKVALHNQTHLQQINEALGVNEQ